MMSRTLKNGDYGDIMHAIVLAEKYNLGLIIVSTIHDKNT